MSQHRPALVPAIFAILSLAMFFAASACAVHAAPCIEKPNAAAPQGEHWYYRTDRATGRQCWYLGPEDSNERDGRKASDRSAPDLPAQPVAPQPAQQPATAAPPAAAETKFSAATNPPSWPAATQLPLMPPLFQPALAPAGQMQASDAIDPPPAPATDVVSQPVSPAIAQSPPDPAPPQSAKNTDHTLALAAIALLTIAISGAVLEVMRWLRRRKRSDRRAPDWDALYQGIQASPGVNSTRAPRRMPPTGSFVPPQLKSFAPPQQGSFAPLPRQPAVLPPPTPVVPPASGSFAGTEKLAEDLQKILDELRRTSFSPREPSELTPSG